MRNIAIKSGDAERAIAMYTETLNERPKHIRARLNRISCYLGLDQAVEAKDDANILLSLAPELAVAVFAKADAQSRLGEWEEAKEGFLAVLEQALIIIWLSQNWVHASSPWIAQSVQKVQSTKRFDARPC